MDKFLLAFGVIMLVIGVKMVYDARPIVKAYFSFGEENEAVIRNENIRICFSNCRWSFIIFLFLNENNYKFG